MYGCLLSEIDGNETVFQVPDSLPIPEEFSYKNYMPMVLDQGPDPICVPCSISAYADWDINAREGTKKHNRINLREIYNCKTTSGEGMSFKEALSFVKNNGINYKGGHLDIRDYGFIPNQYLLKGTLLVNGPCMGTLPVRTDSGAENFWSEDFGSGILGYHAVSIVGYNANGIILRNSWGTSYGSDGYALLPYSDFKNFREMWTIIK